MQLSTQAVKSIVSNQSINQSFLTTVFWINQDTVGDHSLKAMAFPIDPGRPPGEIRPLEWQVPDQGNVGPRAMLPLVPAREQQNHDVLQHAGLGHGQHDDDINMNLENMLPLQQVFDSDQHDDMLEDGNHQLREQVMSPRERDQHQQVNAVQDRQFAFGDLPANVVAENRRQENREYHDGGNVFVQQRNIL